MPTPKLAKEFMRLLEPARDASEVLRRAKVAADNTNEKLRNVEDDLIATLDHNRQMRVLLVDGNTVLVITRNSVTAVEVG